MNTGNKYWVSTYDNAGVKDVKDLLDDPNYNFLSYTAFITKYNIKMNYLEYYKVVSALKVTRPSFFLGGTILL